MSAQRWLCASPVEVRLARACWATPGLGGRRIEPDSSVWKNIQLLATFRSQGTLFLTLRLCCKKRITLCLGRNLWQRRGKTYPIWKFKTAMFYIFLSCWIVFWVVWSRIWQFYPVLTFKTNMSRPCSPTWMAQSRFSLRDCNQSGWFVVLGCPTLNEKTQ